MQPKKTQRKPMLPFIQQKEHIGIQRVVTESTASGTAAETTTHVDAPVHKKEKEPNCHTVKTQRWGCDTACSRVGFVDSETPFTDEHGEFGKSSCCNKWPPFVESFARNHLSLNGVASCKGSMFMKTFKVKFNGKEIRIGCTDSTTATADHELELSPLAAKDLFGSMEFPLNQKVQACEDGALTDVCKLDVSKLNNPHNPAFPRQVDCVEKGCKPQDNSVTCERFDWPKGS